MNALRAPCAGVCPHSTQICEWGECLHALHVFLGKLQRHALIGYVLALRRWAEEHAEPQPEEPAAAITQGEGSDTVAAVASDSTAAAGSDAAGEGGARRRKGGKSDKEKEQEEDSKQDSSDGKGGKKGK